MVFVSTSEHFILFHFSRLKERLQSHYIHQPEETGKATTLGCLCRTWSLLRDLFHCLLRSVWTTLNAQVSFMSMGINDDSLLKIHVLVLICFLVGMCICQSSCACYCGGYILERGIPLLINLSVCQYMTSMDYQIRCMKYCDNAV